MSTVAFGAVLSAWHSAVHWWQRQKGSQISYIPHGAPQPVDARSCKVLEALTWSSGVLLPEMGYPGHISYCRWLAQVLGGGKIWAAERLQSNLTPFLWKGPRTELLHKERWPPPSPGFCRTRLAQVHVQGGGSPVPRGISLMSSPKHLNLREGPDEEAPCPLHAYWLSYASPHAVF